MRIVVLGALLVGASAGFAQQNVDPAGPDGSLTKQPVSVRGCIDNDGDGYSIGDSCGVGVQLDCDDTNSAIYPGAPELCDGRDNDCDGTVDEGYPIGNSCTVGTGACERTGVLLCASTTTTACSVTPGTPIAEVCDGVDNDCNGEIDNDVKLTFYQDADHDGYGNAAVSTQACSAPTDYVANNTDCNDAIASVYPGAVEACNGIDDNCNGSTDETFTTLGQTCSAGIGDCTRPGTQVCNAAHTAAECSAVAGTPIAEVCDGHDNDCDGVIDNGVKTTFYEDSDGDGYGNVAVSLEACTQPAAYVTNHTDCNDASAAVHPDATEICNGIDDNCVAGVDEGFDVGAACTSGLGVCLASGHKVCTAAHDATVCDAVAGTSSPETCNGLDDDCDGVVDNGVKTTFYQDSDGDGYGDLAVSVDACTQPSGHVTNHGDCDDAHASVNPAAAEVCGNGWDDNCNGTVDESDRYADGSGNDTANDCTDALHPCRTIVKAVAQACAGGTVHVGPGTYAGQVTVDKPLTVLGAQHGHAGVVGRPGAESTVVGDLEGGVIQVDSSNVTIDGFEVVGGGSAFAGFQFFDNGNGAFSSITFTNNLVHAMRAPNPYSGSHGAYGLLAGTGAPGNRGTISGLSITANSFYDIGVPGSVPGRGAYVYTVVGGSPGAGATIAGNTFSAIYPKDAGTVGTGITVDVATESPLTPCSGVDVHGNTFSSVAAAASLFATSSSFVQPNASFSGVSVYVVNAGPRATVDESVLPPFARTDRLVGTPHTDAYFAKVSDAVTFTALPNSPNPGDPRGTVFVSAGTFAEQVVINKPLELFGAGKTLSTIKAPATLVTETIPITGGSVTTSSIVRIEGGGSAIPVELHDLAISGPGPSGCGSIGYGLFALGGAVVSVHDAAVVDLRDNPLSGCQNGVAIRAGMQLAVPPSFATLTVTNVDLSTYQKGGVVVDGAGSTGTVINSHFNGVGPVVIAQNGIQISRGATGTITGNTITDHVCDPLLNPANCGEGKSYSAGILLWDVGAVTVSNNPNIDRNDMAIYATAPGAIVTMSGNHIDSSTYEGLVLGQGTMNVSDHQITGGLIGVDLYSSTGDANNAVLNLTHSVISGAAQKGIVVGDDTGDLVHPVLTAHNNHIFGNAAGIVNSSGAGDATGCNWWGAPTGPNGAGANTYSPALSAPATWLLAADFGVDSDGDTYTSCTADSGGDCDVTNAAIHPNATEVCDGIDSDCNGLTDDVDSAAIASCNDGAFCTVGDTCNGTSCTNVARDCGDTNGCTTDACNETLDTCTHTPDCNGTGHVYYATHTGATDGPDLARPLGGFVLDVTGSFSSSTTTSSVPGPGLGTYSVAVAGSVTLTPRVRLVTCGAPSGWDDFDNVNSQDAVAIARIAVGLDTPSPFQFTLADVSASVPPRVSSFDASLVAQKSVNCPGVTFPIKTVSHSDWAFLPASFSDSVTSSPGPTHDFIAALWGDVDELNPPPGFAAPAPAPPHAPVYVTPSTGAELYVASGPRRVGNEWVVVLGLARADGILGLDITLGYDPRAVALKSVRTTGIAGRMSLVSNDRQGEAKLGVFGIDPLVGTGDFLVVSFEQTGTPAGLPFEMQVDANEGQIPVSFGPGTVKPVNPATRGTDLKVGR